MKTVMPEPEGGWRNRWARRRAERAFALDLHTSARQRATAQTAADRDAGRAQDPLSWTMRIVATLVGTFVLAVAAIIALVVVAAQIGFYEAHLTTKKINLVGLGIHHKLDLPSFTPLATEGLVWATTLLAVVMVVLNRTAGLWTRSMWTFAGIAASVNTWYSINDEHDLFGGALRGGLSLAGPFLVHLFILWCRHLRTGRTLAQARVEMDLRWRAIGSVLVVVLIAVGRHLRHPTIAIRATGYRLGVDGWTYQDAWVAASVRYQRTVLARIEDTYTNPIVVWWSQKRADRAKKPVQQRRGKPVRQELPKSAPAVVERELTPEKPKPLVLMPAKPSGLDVPEDAKLIEKARAYFMQQAYRADRDPFDPNDIKAVECDRAVGAKDGYSKRHIKGWRDEVAAAMANSGTTVAGN